MRQALAKSVRRDLRRAMGVGALDHVQAQDQAVGILQNAVASCQREIAALAVNHAEHKRRTAADILTFVKDANDGLSEFKSRPFLGRLRWLFTGK